MTSHSDFETEITIQPVSNNRHLKTFIKLVNQFYQNDPHWVPRLYWERRIQFSKLNPFFKHGRWKAWIAYRGKKPVGRISAQIDELEKSQNRNTGYFGLLEAEDNQDTFQALLQTAESWLEAQGVEKIAGPFSLNINQEMGLLFEGFDSPPYIMSPHNLPYFISRIEECGYQPAMDTLSYIIGVETGKQSADKILAEGRKTDATEEQKTQLDDLVFRPLNPKRLKSEVKLIQEIFNDGWRDNWGFVPFTEEEIANVIKTLLFLTGDVNLVQIAEHRSEPASFAFLVPNWNEILHSLNGKLFPLDWLKVLIKTRANKIKTGRAALLGVKKKFHGTEIGFYAMFTIFRNLMNVAQHKNMHTVELSWLLKDNHAANILAKRLGGKVHKSHRIYTKSLSNSKPAP